MCLGSVDHEVFIQLILLILLISDVEKKAVAAKTKEYTMSVTREWK